METSRYRLPTLKINAKSPQKEGTTLNPFIQIHYPKAWSHIFDEIACNFAKSNYLPKASKSKFNDKDLKFFLKGIRELSEQLTTERKGPRIGKYRNYMNHPRFRSAYLLYFLPLQAAKFYSVLFENKDRLRSYVMARKKIRIVDYGAGPGSATLALFALLEHLDLINQVELELIWIDQNKKIMQDGVDILKAAFPSSKFTIQMHAIPPKSKSFKADLVLFGHILNETEGSPDRLVQWTLETLDQESIGSVHIEPASKQASQRLGHFRDLFVETGSVVSPCAHSSRCPVSMGREWCHFSIQSQAPGRWFKEVSKKLSSEKNWLKFSYVWLSNTKATEKTDGSEKSNSELAISDPIYSTQTRQYFVFTCRPEKPGKQVFDKKPLRIHRGSTLAVARDKDSKKIRRKTR